MPIRGVNCAVVLSVSSADNAEPSLEQFCVQGSAQLCPAVPGLRCCSLCSAGVRWDQSFVLLQLRASLCMWTGFLSEVLAHRRSWNRANRQYLLTLTCWSCCGEPGVIPLQTPCTRNVQQKSFFHFNFLSDFITLIN